MAYFLIDLPHSTWGKREVIQRKVLSRASYEFLQLNEWREEYEEAGFLYEDSNKKEKKTISYWISSLNEEELFMWSHFTTIWNARNFDWWKPVHEDSPFSYVQFPSFGKHPVSQQMNISLSLSCDLYVVW